MFICSSLLPGKPNVLRHYEFIELPSTEALQELQQAVGCCLQECRQAAVFSSTFWWGIGRFLRSCKQAFLEPEDKTAIIAAHQSLTAELLFQGSSSATRGGARPLALIAPKANPWCECVSVKPWGLQSSCRPMPNPPDDAELVSSSMAEAASPVMAGREPTSIPSWASHSHDCLSRWNSRSGKTFWFFFVANGKWAHKKQLAKIKNSFHISSTYVIRNFPSTDVFEKRVRMDTSPIIWNANGREILANLVVC